MRGVLMLFTRLSAILLMSAVALGHFDSEQLYLVQAKAKSKSERNKIANLGVAIDAVYSDSVSFIATRDEIKKLKSSNISVEVSNLPERSWDFPGGDEAFHNYKEMSDAIDALVAANPDIAKRITIGKSLEGRDLIGVRLSSNPKSDSLPTAIFVGCHHAREHLSVEVPLMMAQHLAQNYSRDERIKRLLDSREVWIVPMVNPDGAEYDIATGSYKYWRKNRRPNGDGSYGVDLNRNYGPKTFFGGPGASSSTSSDVYHGPHEFSEPETAAVRDFVRARSKATMLLSFHTFSELVMWPYGHTDEEISDEKTRKVFETMGKTMAGWNKYRPQKSSALYLASGDTTDWAYEELKLFAFTFELSPSSIFSGGFYPGAKAIQPTFKANLEPVLYMIEKSANPFSVISDEVDPLGVL
jgi:carboxypeptidase T